VASALFGRWPRQAALGSAERDEIKHLPAELKCVEQQRGIPFPRVMDRVFCFALSEYIQLN